MKRDLYSLVDKKEDDSELDELSKKMAQVEKDMATIRAKKAARKEQLEKTMTEKGQKEANRIAKERDRLEM